MAELNPPVTLALSVLILKDRVNSQIIIGALLAFIGVILTILLQPTDSNMITMGGFSIGKGELMTAVGAIALAISNIISKIKLDNIPLGIFTIFRTAVGTVVFFSLAVKLYGAGGGVIIIGIILNQIGASRQHDSAKSMNEQVGFKGI